MPSPSDSASRQTFCEARIASIAPLTNQTKLSYCGSGPPLAAPQREPAHVDAERQHDRGLSDHRLSEMARRQLFPDLRVGRHDDAVYLHIACVGSPRAGFQNPLQQGLVHRIRLVAAYRPMLEYRFDHSFLSF